MAHSPCVIFNKNMIFLDINSKALQILNLTKEEVLGKKVIDIFPFIESREPFKAYSDVIKTGDPIDDQLKLIFKEKDFCFSARAFKVGENLGLVGIHITKNGTARKQLTLTRSQLKTAPKNLKFSNEK